MTRPEMVTWLAAPAIGPRRCAAAALAALFASALSPAAAVAGQSPAVIHDAGGGVPYQQLLSQAIAQPSAPAEAQRAAQAVSALVSFPVRTNDIRPGRLAQPATWPYSRWMTAPLFLIGDDPASRRWVRQHAQALGAMGATGLVVNVATASSFVQLQHDAADLQLAPAASPWLASQLARQRSAVVPLLILPNGTLTQDVPNVPSRRGMTAGRTPHSAVQPGRAP